MHKLNLEHRQGFINRHINGLPKLECAINILVEYPSHEQLISCVWLPFDESIYSETEIKPSKGYLGTARSIEQYVGIGFHAWEQNNYEFVYYILDK